MARQLEELKIRLTQPCLAGTEAELGKNNALIKSESNYWILII
jgi:hypothetical protein